MCVICLKPKSKRISDETLRDMFLCNPDGAGIAYRNKGTWNVLKGIMTSHLLIEVMSNLQALTCVIHCRIGTSGTKTPELTHPFSLTNDTKGAMIVKLKQTPIDKDVLFHNGVIPNYGDATISDTVEYITSCLSHIRNPKIQTNALLGTGSKYIICRKQGNLDMVGKFEEYEGLYCSNLNFTYRQSKRYETKYTVYSYNKDTGRHEPATYEGENPYGNSYSYIWTCPDCINDNENYYEKGIWTCSYCKCSYNWNTKKWTSAMLEGGVDPTDKDPMQIWKTLVKDVEEGKPIPKKKGDYQNNILPYGEID